MIVAAVLQVTFYLCVRVSDSIVQMIPYVRGQFLKNPDRHFEYNYCACRHQCHFRGRRPTKPAYNHVACDAAALTTRPGVARRNSLFVSLRRAIAKHAWTMKNFALAEFEPLLKKMWSFLFQHCRENEGKSLQSNNTNYEEGSSTRVTVDAINKGRLLKLASVLQTGPMFW